MAKKRSKGGGFNQAKPLTPEGLEAIKVLRSTVPSVQLFVKAYEYKLARTLGDAKVKSILLELAQSVYPNMQKQSYLSRAEGLHKRAELLRFNTNLRDAFLKEIDIAAVTGFDQYRIPAQIPSNRLFGHNRESGDLVPTNTSPMAAQPIHDLDMTPGIGAGAIRPYGEAIPDHQPQISPNDALGPAKRGTDVLVVGGRDELSPEKVRKRVSRIDGMEAGGVGFRIVFNEDEKVAGFVSERVHGRVVAKSKKQAVTIKQTLSYCQALMNGKVTAEAQAEQQRSAKLALKKKVAEIGAELRQHETLSSALKKNAEDTQIRKKEEKKLQKQKTKLQKEQKAVTRKDEEADEKVAVAHNMHAKKEKLMQAHAKQQQVAVEGLQTELRELQIVLDEEDANTAKSERARLALERATKSAQKVADGAIETLKQRDAELAEAHRMIYSLQQQDTAEEVLQQQASLRRFKRGTGRFGGFHRDVQEIAMRMVTRNISYNDCEWVYATILEKVDTEGVLDSGCGEGKRSNRDYLLPTYFKRAAQRLRVLGLCMNTVCIATAKEWLAIGGDGFSDHSILRGIQEFFAFTHEIMNDENEYQAISLDGFLQSFGLTSDEEAQTCERIMVLLRFLLGKLKELFAVKYPRLIKTAKYLGEEVRVENVGLVWYHVIKADGAAGAQCWARLMGEGKEREIYEQFSTEQLEALPPQDLAILFYWVTTNCSMHNFHLGAAYGGKAMRKVTEEAAAPGVQKLRDEGYVSNSFSHCPLLSQCIHTCSKFGSTSEGYQFGEASALKLFCSIDVECLERVYFGISKVRNGRFAHSYRACRQMYFMLESLRKMMFSQYFSGKLKKIIDSLSSQLFSYVLMSECRVQEALLNAIFEPLEVLLGLEGDLPEEEQPEEDPNHVRIYATLIKGFTSHMKKADASSSDDDAMVGEDSGSTSAIKAVVAWWFSDSSSDSRDLECYRKAFSEEDRADLAGLVETRDDRIRTEVQRCCTISGADCTRQAASLCRLIIDGSLPPPAISKSGMFHHIDLFKHAIKTVKEIKERPLTIYCRKRPSERFADWGGHNTHTLREWEKVQYKKKGYNGAGKLVAESKREWMDEKRWKPDSEDLETPEALALQKRLIVAACDAIVMEWEKMLKKGLVGELRESCRTEWQKVIFDKVMMNTMRTESAVGTAKAARKEMHTGSNAAIKGKANARQSGVWPTFEKMSVEEQDVVMDVVRMYEGGGTKGTKNDKDRHREVKEYDILAQAKHDAAQGRRAWRAMDKETNALAQTYADAKVFHGCELWEEAKVDDELADALYKTTQIKLMEEQIDIMVLGGGFIDLRPAKKSGEGVCESCHTAFGSYLEHLVVHVKWALQQVVARGGMPDQPPKPILLLHRPKFKLPPVLQEEQIARSAKRFMRIIEEKAEKRVTDGKVRSMYEKVGGCAMPALDDNLIGKHVEYIFNDDAAKTPKGHKKKLLCAYSGTILSINLHDTIAVAPISRRRKKAPKSVAKVTKPSFLVRWHEQAAKPCQQESRVFLEEDYYNKCVQDGWRVYEESELEPPKTANEETYIQRLDRGAFEAEFLCFKLEK